MGINELKLSFLHEFLLFDIGYAFLYKGIACCAWLAQLEIHLVIFKSLVIFLHPFIA